MGEGPSLYELINFSGALSELNIWSSALSIDEMIEITLNCMDDSFVPLPDILKWSDVKSYMVTGDSREEALTDLCYYSLDPVETVLSVPLNQNQAILACQSLKATLYAPHHLEKVNGR